MLDFSNMYKQYMLVLSLQIIGHILEWSFPFSHTGFFFSSSVRLSIYIRTHSPLLCSCYTASFVLFRFSLFLFSLILFVSLNKRIHTYTFTYITKKRPVKTDEDRPVRFQVCLGQIHSIVCHKMMETI
jgi:hypothetical protein